MLKKILKIERVKHLDYFTWMMFPYCNYNCSYCFEKEMYFGNEKIDIEELKKIANKIYDYCNINNILRLNVFGGEPTILDYSKIIYIFEKFLNDKKIIFEITTNFYRDIDYFFNLLKAFKNNYCFYITCSFHEEFTTQVLFFKKILKLSKLAEEFPNSKIKIKVVINKNNENNIRKFFNNYKIIKKFSNIELEILEGYKINNNFRMIDIYDSSKIINKNPDMEGYFCQNKSYNVLTEDNKTSKMTTKQICSFLNTTNLSCKGYKCYKKDVVLKENKLIDLCHGIITNDFLNYNVAKVNQEGKICTNNICPEVFDYIER